jgi:hypothetical protein
MTADTAHLHVLSLQGECCGLVVEVCYPVLTVVAVQTIRAEILAVLDDKAQILFCMAQGTVGLGHSEIGVLLVAGGAVHWRCIVIDLMVQQAKVCRGVIKIGISRLPEVKISALVIGVAGITLLDVG